MWTDALNDVKNFMISLLVGDLGGSSYSDIFRSDWVGEVFSDLSRGSRNLPGLEHCREVNKED